jgi:hypothetical protein
LVEADKLTETLIRKESLSGVSSSVQVSFLHLLLATSERNRSDRCWTHSIST